ncbi:MAG: hypothetical protein AB7U63_19405, partial [Porticoccaceae bacterium]
MPQCLSSALPKGILGFAVIFSASLLLGGCAQQVSPASHAQLQPSRAVPSSSANTQALNQAEEREKSLNYGPLGGQNENLSNAELAALPRHLRVHFAQNSFHVSARARHITAENARFLLRFPNLHVRLEGNCSQPGTQEYNLGLGEW